MSVLREVIFIFSSKFGGDFQNSACTYCYDFLYKLENRMHYDMAKLWLLATSFGHELNRLRSSLQSLDCSVG
jgi:hypothetical protein